MNTKPQILSRSFFCRHRFALTCMKTRFGTDEWFLADAEKPDSDGLPEIVYQGNQAGALAIIKAEQERIFAQDEAAFAS